MRGSERKLKIAGFEPIQGGVDFQKGTTTTTTTTTTATTTTTTTSATATGRANARPALTPVQPAQTVSRSPWTAKGVSAATLTARI